VSFINNGASRIAGKYKGSQAQIQVIHFTALFVWGTAHRYNLAVGCCPAIKARMAFFTSWLTFLVVAVITSFWQTCKADL
jgi:hypothetical protein